MMEFEIGVSCGFVVGAVANILALWILHISAKTRNKKHVLLLRCLAVNDLVAQIGMLSKLHLSRYKLIPTHWNCVGYVLFRGFALGSGCVALVMALERWLALTRPFLYHQLVTYQTLKRFVFGLWLSGVLLTYLPFFGFGVYYNENNSDGNNTSKCVRFRYATETNDVIYAYLFFGFGTVLCLCIAFCNSMVAWELLRLRSSRHRVLVRRISRSIISRRINSTRYQTPEEVAFAKLMVVVCVIFVICWAPLLISIPITQMTPESKRVERNKDPADLLLVFYFMLDPFVYVLQRYIEKGNYFSSFFYYRKTPTTPTTTTTTTMGTPTSVLLHPPSFPIPPAAVM